jgi:hypothetical protein
MFLNVDKEQQEHETNDTTNRNIQDCSWRQTT